MKKTLHKGDKKEIFIWSAKFNSTSMQMFAKNNYTGIYWKVTAYYRIQCSTGTSIYFCWHPCNASCPRNGQTQVKNLAAFAARFLTCVWPFSKYLSLRGAIVTRSYFIARLREKVSVWFQYCIKQISRKINLVSKIPFTKWVCKCLGMYGNRNNYTAIYGKVKAFSAPAGTSVLSCRRPIMPNSYKMVKHKSRILLYLLQNCNPCFTI